MKNVLALLGLTAMSVSTGGCAVLAGVGLGVMAHDEATEDDGEFDPLEKVEDALDDDDNK